ncbi:MAG: DM13 domain-containing protein [Flavobacterium sp.]|nr:DM13 domain-containing protein [Flavobacterium sp.]
MKKYVMLYFLILLFLSCESEGEFTRTEVGSVPVTTDSILQYSGSFLPTSGIEVAGTANIYKDGSTFKVSLEGFSISSGPDLKVYLSTSESPNQFINLGALGNGMLQTYVIPNGVDFTLYNHVLIHCQQYSHLYAIAALEATN